MNDGTGLNNGLSNLYLLSNAQTRSISAENLTGQPGGGARDVPPGPHHPSNDLGRGWKVQPSLELPKESTTTLADIQGPGMIQHIWITLDPKFNRDCVLRFYWDDETTPSVETPLGDFFANGHGLKYQVNSLPVCVNPTNAMNCYWPMPFRKRCRITIENQRWEHCPCCYFQITYALCDIPENAAYFHGQWRRSVTKLDHPEHIILDSVKGQGHYVGTFLAWTQMTNGWWGEGEIKFFMDGDKEFPTICGTGTEDYVGGAWGFYDEKMREIPYSTPFLGCPLVRHVDNEVPKFALYRWHVMDPIRFQKELRVTIQALGWYPNLKFRPLDEDIASVAYWYQTEPHVEFPELPALRQRWPR